MLNRFISIVVFPACVLVISGCARDKSSAAFSDSKPAPEKRQSGGDRKLIVTPEERLQGKVAWVNSNLRFVVMTFPVGQMARPGQYLNVYRKGLKVGEVRVTGPQRDDSTVADILSGDAGAGDVVLDR